MTATLLLLGVLLVAAAAAAVLISAANRLDRLHVRTDAAWAVLLAALARRAVVTRAIAASEAPGASDASASDASASDAACASDASASAGTDVRGRTAGQLRDAADQAEGAGRASRELRENKLTAALAALDRAALDPGLAAELDDAEQRVVIARQVYNDAVRDTLARRRARVVRYFRLAGGAPLPAYFEITEPGPRG